MIKIAYFLAFASGSSFTIYGQRGKMLGRTQLNKHLKRQVLRMPDEPAKREDWTRQVFLTFDNGNPPMPHILAEDTDQEIGSEKRFGPVDLSELCWRPTPPEGEGVPVPVEDIPPSPQGPNPDPKPIGNVPADAAIAASMQDAIKSNGRLTIQQLAELLDRSSDVIEACALGREDLFTISSEGWVDLVPVAPTAKKPAKKKSKAKKPAKK